LFGDHGGRREEWEERHSRAVQAVFYAENGLLTATSCQRFVTIGPLT
jgi:hypothetical protein